LFLVSGLWVMFIHCCISLNHYLFASNYVYFAFLSLAWLSITNQNFTPVIFFACALWLESHPAWFSDLHRDFITVFLNFPKKIHLWVSPLGRIFSHSKVPVKLGLTLLQSSI
jgi:hypothetical protein